LYHGLLSETRAIKKEKEIYDEKIVSKNKKK
jgi:hypothetical protein